MIHERRRAVSLRATIKMGSDEEQCIFEHYTELVYFIRLIHRNRARTKTYGVNYITPPHMIRVLDPEDISQSNVLSEPALRPFGDAYLVVPICACYRSAGAHAIPRNATYDGHVVRPY